MPKLFEFLKVLNKENDEKWDWCEMTLCLKLLWLSTFFTELYYFVKCFFSVFAFLNIGIILEKWSWSMMSWTWSHAIFEKNILSLSQVPSVVKSMASFCNIRPQFDCIHGSWGIRGRITPLLMCHVCTKSSEYKWLICFHHWT